MENKTLEQQVQILKAIYLAAAVPTLNYGPGQFNGDWNPNSEYYFNLYTSQTTHSVCYAGGYYFLVGEPNGLPPNQDTDAWKLVATVEGGSGSGVYSINGSTSSAQEFTGINGIDVSTIPTGITTITTNFTDADGNILPAALPIVAEPTFTAKSDVTVPSTSGLFYTLQNSLGTGLSWNNTTKKIDASPVADYSKYNYPISSKVAISFAVGEEYLLNVATPSDDIEYNLTLLAANKAGAANFGEVNLKLSINFNAASTYLTGRISGVLVSQAGSWTPFNQTQLNSMFAFKVYNVTTPVTINGVAVSGIIYTITLNTAFPSTGTDNSIFALVSTNSAANFTGAVNPSNNALLAKTGGSLSSPSTIVPNYTVATNAAGMVDNNIPKWLTGVLQDSGVPISAVTYQYTKIKYIDPDNGSDTTGTGAYSKPWKTVAYAQSQMSQSTVGALLGKTTEAALTLTKPNIDWITFGTRSALCGFTNKVTVNNTTAGSIRFTGLAFDGGIEESSTNTGGIYIYNGQIGVPSSTSGFTKNGSGYVEFVGVDASNYLNTITKGTFLVLGGKVIAPTISGVGTQVTLDNVGLVFGNVTVGVGSVLLAFESNWLAASSGYAISGVANSTVVIDGINLVRSDGVTPAPVSLLGNFSIQHCDFGKTTSVLTGTNIGAADWFDKIGLLNTPTITTATKMLVKDPTTGEIAEQLIPTSAAKSTLYLSGWGTDVTVANGNLTFDGSTGDANIGSAITHSGANISLATGKNYMVTVMINSIQSGQPSASKQQMDYSGSTFTGANIAVTNGAINNNIYTCTSSGGAVAFANAYNSGGNMNLFVPTALINPVQMAVSPQSTNSNMYGYTQVTSSAGLPIIVKDSTITSQTLTRSVSVGGIFADNNSAFNHPFNGSNPAEYAACAGFNKSIVSDSLNATRFAFSNDNGNTYTSQATPLANTVTLESSLTACYAQDINNAVFVGTSGVSCLVNLTAGTFTQVNISAQGIKQVVRGTVSGVANFVAVGNNNTWNQIQKSTDGSSWLTLATNNLPSILPTAGSPVYSIAGVCQTKDGLGAWLVAVNDTANNKIYICSSSDLVTFSTLVNYDNFNVNGLFTEKISGVGLSTGATAIFAYSSNTPGAGNIVVYNNGFWATPSDWKTIANPAGLSTAQRGFMYQNGVFALWGTGGVFNIVYSADGGNTWVSKTSLTSFTYMMPLGDYQICSCSTVSASRKYSASYRNTYTTAILYNAMWLGGQNLQSGTSSNSTVTLSNQVIASYTDNNGIGPMQISGAAQSISSANQQYFKVGVNAINTGEQVLGLYATSFVISNTFLYRINGTNCTVTGTTQAPGLQGDVRTCLQAVVTNVNASAVINLNFNYNNGTNKLGGNNSISVQEI